MDNENIQKQILKTDTDNQFTVSPTTGHTHNGTDSLLITTVSLSPGTPVKLGLGAILSFSNGKASGAIDEQIQTSITSGKDFNGSVGTTSNNLILSLLHQPQNASNQSFIIAFRPPIYANIPGTTISVTNGGNTVTTAGYGFTTNILAGALINIFDSSGTLVETQTIASNTSTVITIVDTWLYSTSNGNLFIFQPVFFGSSQNINQRFYTQESTGGGIRFGVGPTNTGQNGLLYMDSTGNLYWRDKAGSSSQINGGSGSGVDGRSSGTAVTSISNATFTKLTPSNDFANGVTWDNTNKRFVIITAGQYIITGQTTYINIAGGTQYLLEIRKNGSQVIQLTQGGTATWDLSLTGTDILDLAVSDYLELWTRQNSGGSQNVSNSNLTHLSIAKV